MTFGAEFDEESREESAEGVGPLSSFSARSAAAFLILFQLKKRFSKYIILLTITPLGKNAPLQPPHQVQTQCTDVPRQLLKATSQPCCFPCN